MKETRRKYFFPMYADSWWMNQLKKEKIEKLKLHVIKSDELTIIYTSICIQNQSMFRPHQRDGMC